MVILMSWTYIDSGKIDLNQMTWPIKNRANPIKYFGFLDKKLEIALLPKTNINTIFFQISGEEMPYVTRDL